MQVKPLKLAGVFEITPQKFGDARGFFAETFSQARFVAHRLPGQWVQDNHSRSAASLVLRGLHYQVPPHAQDKLVRVLKGAIFDVAVDIRHGSPSFGQWLGLEVSAERFNQIFVPKGFAHGFVTLEPDTEVAYKVTAPYAPEHERAILWNDPDLGIAWPLGGAAPVLSAKDQVAGRFAGLESGFMYEEQRA